ncbi:MAG TPA: hypothetical protein VK968_02425, partial [Roseimicrobium sp.]|nr:hypothetical protein [Roseimicrobium sp.]
MTRSSSKLSLTLLASALALMLAPAAFAQSSPVQGTFTIQGYTDGTTYYPPLLSLDKDATTGTPGFSITYTEDGSGNGTFVQFLDKLNAQWQWQTTGSGGTFLQMAMDGNSVLRLYDPSTQNPVIVIDPNATTPSIKINGYALVAAGADGRISMSNISTTSPTQMNVIAGPINIGTSSTAANGASTVQIVTTAAASGIPSQGVVITNPSANASNPDFGMVLQTRENSAYIGLTNCAGVLGFGNPAFGPNLTLDFANVGSLNQVPIIAMRSSADNFWIPGGKSGSAIVVAAGDAVLALAANELTDNTHSGINLGRGMLFRSYSNTTTTGRGFNFKFDTATASSGLAGFVHTQWSVADSPVMTLTPAGNLGVGTAAP